MESGNLFNKACFTEQNAFNYISILINRIIKSDEVKHANKLNNIQREFYH